MYYLHGHFQEITQIELNQKFILTASRDFSARLWDADYGQQLCLFLDINCQNSDLISLVSNSILIKILDLSI